MKGIAKSGPICQTICCVMSCSRFRVFGASGRRGRPPTRMGRLAVFALLGAALLWGSGCRQAVSPEPPKVVAKPRWDTLFSVHFAGSRQILAETNAATLRSFLELPETAVLGTNVVGKITAVMAGFVAAPAQIEESKERVSPLVQDLIGHEFWLTLRRPQGGHSEWTCAVLLDSEKLPVWRTNAWQMLASMGSDSNVVHNHTAPGSNGFEVVLSNRTVRVASVGNWFLCGVGAEALPGFAEVVSATLSTGRPLPSAADYWVRSELDMEMLKGEKNLIMGAPLSKISLAISGHNGRMTTTGSFVFREEPKLRLETWRIPTNAVHDPLVSFTASQGFDTWAHVLFPSTNVTLPEVSSQLFVWAREDMPFMTLAATPVSDATNALLSLSSALVSSANARLDGKGAGGLIWNPNRPSIVWRGLPAFVPYLEPFVDGEAQFLHGGFFPLTTQPTNPAPTELLGQVAGRTNLVYYDWEITETRLGQWAQMFQYASLLSTRPQLGLGGPSRAWLAAVAPLLGNTVTEIIQVSPKEFHLNRRSHIGLTGVELNLFAQWFDEPSFPFAGLRMPFQPLGFPTPSPSAKRAKKGPAPGSSTQDLPVPGGPVPTLPVPPAPQ